MLKLLKSSNKTSSTQTYENITKIKCPPLELLQPLSSTTRTNLSISTPDVSTSSSSTQAQLLPSTSSISSSNSESQPPIPTCKDAPSNNMVTPIESSSSITPTSLSQSVIPPPSDSNTVQDAKKLAKARSRKRKKELLKKMKEAIIDIKMNPHRPKKPVSDEYTSDEEEMIVYDVEDEIESNPDYVKENDLRRRKLSLAYYSKILSVPSHPLQNVYMITSMKRLYDARPSNIRPFMDRMKHLVSELDLPNVNNQQRNLLIFQHWNTPRFHYINPFATYSKFTVAPVVFQRVFAYHRSQYSRYSASTLMVRNVQITLAVEL
ncbi:RNase H domain-containing protein [Trichonephila clavipes]|nr:RNase H domain-containing protein [Trichonephila clavipes]